MHYGTTVLYCVVYINFIFLPTKINDNEKLWIYGILLFLGFFVTRKQSSPDQDCTSIPGFAA